MKVLFAFLLAIFIALPASAHPGKTDRYGGHKCYKECAEWDLYYAEYHLHDKDGRPVKVARRNRSGQSQRPRLRRRNPMTGLRRPDTRSTCCRCRCGNPEPDTPSCLDPACAVPAPALRRQAQPEEGVRCEDSASYKFLMKSIVNRIYCTMAEEQDKKPSEPAPSKSRRRPRSGRCRSIRVCCPTRSSN